MIPNEGDVFTTMVRTQYHHNGQLITCPECGADKGIHLSAFAADRSAVGTCPAGHTWDEPRVTGREVRNLYVGRLQAMAEAWAEEARRAHRRPPDPRG